MPPRKINLVEAADRTITNVFDPHVAGDVNDSQAKRRSIHRDGPITLDEQTRQQTSQTWRDELGISRF